jgi:hypothetical protein
LFKFFLKDHPGSLSSMRDRDWVTLRAQARVLRQQGFSLRQIGRRLHVVPGLVGRWVADVPFSGFSDEARAEQMAVRRDPATYERARSLRRAGWTYSMIAAELSVNKSTLSGWLRHESSTGSEAARRSRIARGKSGETRRRQHQEQTPMMRAAAATEICDMFTGGLSQRELLLMGLMLYWAEGAKTQGIALTNSDPYVIKAFVLWLERCLGVSRAQLKAEVHAYPNLDIDEAERYWADVIGVPATQFYKPQIDLREKKRSDKHGRLPYGTVHVKVIGRGSSELHRRVLGWIAGFAHHMVQ